MTACCLLALAVLLCSSCAADRPERTVERFLDLVAKKKITVAYGLMAPAFREQCDVGCFARSVGEHREELLRLREPFAREKARVEVRAGLDLSPEQGPPLLLCRAGKGEWLLRGDPLDFYPQGTPTEALRSFMRAVQGRRYDVVLRFVPQRLRQQVSVDRLRESWEGPRQQEMQAQLLLARQHLKEPFIIEGTEARLPVGERKEVRLSLDAGLWHVEKLQ